MKTGLKVAERKLGRERAWGYYWNDGRIEIDPRQKAKQYLDTLVHELLHHCWPSASESKISRSARLISHHVWGARYRRVEK